MPPGINASQMHPYCRCSASADRKEYEWQKKKGFGYLDYEGESYKAEVHWYEEPTAGKHKFKAKSYNGEWIIDEE